MKECKECGLPQCCDYAYEGCVYCLETDNKALKARVTELEGQCAAEQLVINRAHKLILAAERQLSESGGLIPGMLKEYREALAALREGEKG